MDASDADVGREKATASFKRDGDAADGVRISSVQLVDSVDYEKLEKANQAIDRSVRSSERMRDAREFFKEQRVSYERWTE